MKLFLFLITLGMLGTMPQGSFGQTETSAIILPLDQKDSPDRAMDASGAHRDLNYPEPNAVTVTSDGPKHGAGNLSVVEALKRAVFTQPVTDSPYNAWTGPIEKLSIVLWVYIPTEDPRSELTLISRNYNFGTGTAGYFIFSISNTAGLRFIATGHNPVRTGPETASLKPGNWVHLAMVYDKGQVHFYQDGDALPTIGETSTDSIPALERIDQKAQLTGLEKMPVGGRVDDVGIFVGTAFSASDIREIERKGLTEFARLHPEVLGTR